MTRPATTHDERASAPRKSTLFCWECDHSSPVDGDWLRRTRDRHVAYVCPECETTITKRPLPDDATDGRPTIRPTATWRRTVRTAIGVWRASIGVGLSSVTAIAFGSAERRHH